MSDEIQFRTYQPGDEKQIVELLNVAFKGWPRFDVNCTSLEHWRWKYLDNPLNQLFITVAVSEDKIVACDHSVPKKIVFGGKSDVIAFGVDIAVHPDFRGLGLSSKIREMRHSEQLKNNVDLNFSHSTNPLLLQGNIRGGSIRFPQEVSYLLRINDLNLFFDKNRDVSAVKKYGLYVVKNINKIESGVIKKHSYDMKIVVDEIDKFTDDMDIFWNEIKNNYDFIIEKSKDYLNWRYCDVKGGDYVVKQAKINDDVVGFIILRINRYEADNPEGYIVDILTDSKRSDVVEALALDAVKYFDEEKVNIINCWVTKDNFYSRIFKKFGFLDSKKDLDLFFKNYSDISNKIKMIKTSHKNKVHFVYGDIDEI